MSDPRGCQRAQALHQRGLLEEGALSAEERAFLAQHHASCATCVGVDSFLSALAHDGPEAMGRDLDDAQIDRAAEALLDAMPHPAARGLRWPRLSWPWLLAGPAGIAAAAALLVVLRGHLVTATSTPQAASSAAISGGEVLELATGTRRLQVLDHAQVLAVAPARLRQAPAAGPLPGLHLEHGSVLLQVAPLPAGQRFGVHTPGGSVWVVGTRFAVRASHHMLDVQLAEGTLEIDAGGSRTRIAAPSGWRTGAGARRLSAEELRLLQDAFAGAGAAQAWQAASVEAARQALAAGSAGTTGAAAHAGRQDASHGDRARAVDAGERALEQAPRRQRPAREKRGQNRSRRDRGAALEAQRGSAPAGRAAPVRDELSVEEILARAQERHAAADWRGAVAAYRQLQRLHPHSGEALTSLVPMGQLQLEKLSSPAAALLAFRTYQERSATGVLAEEAALGEIEALRAMGRADQEREACARFLRRYPRSLAATKVKQRLDGLPRAP